MGGVGLPGGERDHQLGWGGSVSKGLISLFRQAWGQREDMPHGRTDGWAGGCIQRDLRLEEAGGRGADAALMGWGLRGGSRPGQPGTGPGVLWG